MTFSRLTSLFSLAIILCACLATTDARAEKPKGKLKVFVLAGQSNMVGKGFVYLSDSSRENYKKQGKESKVQGALCEILKDPAKKDKYAHLVAADGTPVVRDDVWYFWHQQENRGKDTYSNVKLSLPVDGSDSTFASRGKFGPELQFGHVIGDEIDEPVLLIKTAWGGKSLGMDFRPPSAGRPKYPLKKKADGSDPDIGKYYLDMTNDVKYALNNLKKLYPDYEGQGYEIVGFVWFQGWNDGCNAEYFAPEYESNLEYLFADIRRSLGNANLPIVVIGSGFGGNEKLRGGVLTVIRDVIEPAQKKIAEKDGNATFVPIRDFCHPESNSPGGGVEHFYGNAETYFKAGDAAGKAMKELLNKKPETSSIWN